MNTLLYFGNVILNKHDDKDFSKIILENLIPYKKKSENKSEVFYQDCIFTKRNLKSFLKILKAYASDKTEIDTYQGDFNCYVIGCDGGSFNNGYKDPNLPMFASSVAIIAKNKKIINVIQKRYKDKTNNFGELNAGIMGLDYLIKNEKITQSDVIIISSDSQYLMKGMNEWIYGWIKRGWKNNENQPISNLEEWKYLWTNYLNNPKYNITTCWTRGHSVTQLNEDTPLFVKLNYSCDYLCNMQINKSIEENNVATKIRKIKGKEEYEKLCLNMTKMGFTIPDYK